MGSSDERVVPMRLQRFLARAGVASRRGSEALMTAGRVCVNGEVTRAMGSKVDPATDVVTVDGREVRLSGQPCYLVLNKPAGYLTTMSDPHGRRCVASLVPRDEYPGIFPVGRLDCDTTGVLLFTTNGDVGQALLHPSHHVTKHYLALVRGRPDEAQLQRLRDGIELDDGMTAPAQVDLHGPTDRCVKLVAPHGVKGDASVVGITLHEGRKHQVKRMLSAVGHEVMRLHRDRFGPLTLRGCKEGFWRALDQNEVRALEACAHDMTKGSKKA